MTLLEISKNSNDNIIYARRTDWEEDMFMARKYKGKWELLHPISGTPLKDMTNRQVALNSPKWEKCNVHGEFIK
jgi:hypothetical protein